MSGTTMPRKISAKERSVLERQVKLLLKQVDVMEKTAYRLIDPARDAISELEDKLYSIQNEFEDKISEVLDEIFDIVDLIRKSSAPNQQERACWKGKPRKARKGGKAWEARKGGRV